MNGYIGIEVGNMISLALPMHMLVFNVLFFIKNYQRNKFNRYVLIVVMISILTTFYFYTADYSLKFVSFWAMNSLIAPFFYGYVIAKPINTTFESINFVEKIIYILELIIGVILMIIPFTNIYIEPNEQGVVIVSKILIVMLGLTYIVLNKFTIHCIRKRMKF